MEPRKQTPFYIHQVTKPKTAMSSLQNSSSSLTRDPNYSVTPSAFAPPIPSERHFSEVDKMLKRIELSRGPNFRRSTRTAVSMLEQPVGMGFKRQEKLEPMKPSDFLRSRGRLTPNNTQVKSGGTSPSSSKARSPSPSRMRRETTAEDTEVQEPAVTAPDSAGGPAPPKVFKFKCTISGTISDAMRRRGWLEVKDNDESWNIYWCDILQLRELYMTITKPLTDYQRVGHFRNSIEISRKNLMLKNLKKLKSRLEKEFGKDEGEKLNFYPITFILPDEHNKFLEEFRREPATWIIKPAAGAQGRGIYIFSKLREYNEWRARFDPVEYQRWLHQRHRSGTGNEVLDNSTDGNNTMKTGENSNYSSNKDLDAPETANSTAAIDSVDPASAEPMSSVPCVELHRSNDDSSNFPGQSRDSIGTPDDRGSDCSPRTPGRNDVFVVQKYLLKPYLLGGRKFDIRLYIMVQSFVPLKVWMYREGFARFSGGQYSTTSLQDIYIHLTNVAIQRTSDRYDHERGSKWSMYNLREFLTDTEGPEAVYRLMCGIDNIIIRTLQSGQFAVQQDKHCFEVYGFDILFDEELKPWLLEVNSSPAFTPSSEEDYRLKCSVIDDTVHILDLEERLTGFEKRVGGFDLMWNNGPVYVSDSPKGRKPKLNSYLGCYNDRVQQLYNLFELGTYIRDTRRHHMDDTSSSPFNGELIFPSYEEYRQTSITAPNPTNLNNVHVHANQSQNEPKTSQLQQLSSENKPTRLALGVSLHDLCPPETVEDSRFRVPEEVPQKRISREVSRLSSVIPSTLQHQEKPPDLPFSKWEKLLRKS